MKKNILHIHGFNSSPLSLKAEQTRKYIAKNFPNVGFYCPQLATTPANAISQLEQLIETHDSNTKWYLIGSSLGGYFAHYLAKKYDCLAVLVNPAITPYELLHDYIGEQVNPYTEEVYQVTEDHIQQLKALEKTAPTIDCTEKNNYLVMVQTGDEVLNYQQAVEKYQHCRLIVQEGGDHSFINFENCLPTISDFFQLDNTKQINSR
ncbi:YqiA/YcfP family alpha/beta fold hydrolase [Colwellia sp. Bg11-28]|uniref:YqiA/YcfP family alpha/beta fold hydrolase n=1 Tax=Colwellia sp. Bg11-28 TaxID=2058305 RepID=UPI000C32C07A|nr:YqiA/YcfP family alpha/beta fold hydrolase [Colwellia sp. Bg11-28]PKH85314.1 esterase YqiA [Colwellia sp. Bg11-28]